MKFQFVIVLSVLAVSALSTLPNYSQLTQNELSTSQNSKVTITFKAKSLIATNSLELEEIKFIDGFVIDQYAMTEVDAENHLYEKSLQLIPGTLFKYRYGISWLNWESHDLENNRFDAHYRVLLVPNVNIIVNEEVIGFTEGTIAPSVTFANVTGQVVDSTSGEGITEGIIWIGGISSKISANGTYYLQSIPTGQNRATIISYDHEPIQTSVVVTEGTGSINNEITLATFSVSPTPQITVTFLVEVPDFQDTNQLLLIGDHPLMGYQYPYTNDVDPMRMQHIHGDWYIASVNLHTKVPITYFYSFGSSNINAEWNLDQHRVYRKIAFTEETIVQDEVESWDIPDFHKMQFQVTVPENTPRDQKVYLAAYNQLIEMSKVSGFEYKTSIWVPPYESTFSYYYQLGSFTGMNWEMGHDFSQPRDVISNNQLHTDVVEGWRWIANVTSPAVAGTVNFTLTVNVPYYTPNETLYLMGDPFTNDWNNPQGKALTQQEDFLYSTTLILEQDQEYSFSLTRGDPLTKATRNFTVTPAFSGQSIHQYIDGWVDIQGTWNRTSLIAGMMTLDWWDPNMRDLIEPGFKHFAEMGGEWVEYAVIWQFHHISPTTFINDVPGMPDKDLEFLVDLAHKYNLKFYLSIGLNTELTADNVGVGLVSYNVEQWEVFRKQYLAVVDHHSKLAEKFGIEMIAPPGYQGENKTQSDVLRHEGLDLIRENYHGMVTSSIGWTESDLTFLDRLDFLGMYMWDNLLPGNDDPTVVELETEFATRLDTIYRDFYVQNNKHILFSQFAYSATTGSNYVQASDLPAWLEGAGSVDYREDIQARIYEAFFRAIQNRTWVDGLFSFGNTYTPFNFPDYSISFKAAEAVLFKWGAMIQDKNFTLYDDKYQTRNTHSLSMHGQLDETRILDPQSNTWSSWISGSTIDVANYISGSQFGGGKFVLWVQGKLNGKELMPISITLAIDDRPPEVLSEPNYSLPSDLDPAIFIFGDDLDLTIHIAVSGSETWSSTLYMNRLVIPKALFPIGTSEVAISVTDELDRTINREYIILIEEDVNSQSSGTSSKSGDSSDRGFISFSLSFSLIFASLLILRTSRKKN